MNESQIKVKRLEGNPIIHKGLHHSIGSNIQGPSLIKVPPWVESPLGKYYLYFADHKGSYIRMAYGDSLTGPWLIHEPGTLQLGESHFLTEDAAIPDELIDQINKPEWIEAPARGVPSTLVSATKPHIASPDVHVREDRQEIVMYFHGLEAFQMQPSRVATSIDGIHFKSRKALVGHPYMRAFRHDERWYALGMPGIFYRSADGISGFEPCASRLFPSTMRHCALVLDDHVLTVLWSRVGDAPEHILLTRIDVSGDWNEWVASEPESLLLPEMEWEGAGEPVVPSIRDAINIPVNQLRDPALYIEEGMTYLLYAVAGESGIAIAQLQSPLNVKG